VPPKGKELVARALKHGRAKPRGPGEASSLRALKRRELLDSRGEPNDQTRLWASVQPGDPT
jgi:hypothetical protein